MKALFTRLKTRANIIPSFGVTAVRNSLFFRITKRGRRKADDFPWLEGAKTSYITSRDGLKLCARTVSAGNPERIILAVHGWRSGPRDFACQHEILERLGCTVVYIDQRAHGSSGGRYITFGLLERFDCADWTEYIRQTYGDALPVYLFGVSMGAATVMYASGLELCGNIRGIIADCGFTSPSDIWKSVVSDTSGIDCDLWLRLFCKKFERETGLDSERLSTVDALKKTDIPCLFIHGESDTFVPCDMSRRNYQACASEKRLVTVRDAVHAASCRTSPLLYENELVKFFAENDKRNNL